MTETQQPERDQREIDLAEALLRLNQTKDFQLFTDYLFERLIDVREKNDFLDAPEVYRGQGMAKDIMDILGKILKAADLKAKFATRLNQRYRAGLRQVQ